MLFHERAIMLGHLKPEIFFVLRLLCWKSSCQSKYHPKEKPLIKILIKGYSNDISVESPRSISLPMTAHNFRWFLGFNVENLQNFADLQAILIPAFVAVSKCDIKKKKQCRIQKFFGHNVLLKL